jgi:hypothetical protein
MRSHPEQKSSQPLIAAPQSKPPRDDASQAQIGSTDPEAMAPSLQAQIESAQRLGHSCSTVFNRGASLTRLSTPLATPLSTPLTPIVQMASYMRALNGDNRVAGEIASLRREFLNQTQRNHQVNTWVDGFAGMPTARFTDENRHYYSPVGYKLETTDDDDVLANYEGDGNTNDIPVTHPRWVEAAKNLRQVVMEIPDYVAWAQVQEDEMMGLDDKVLPEVNSDSARWLRDNYINYFLTPYLEAPLELETPEASQARREGQTSVRNAIKTCGIAALRDHYSTPQGVTATDRYIGTGVAPEGMTAAVANPDIPYIESILHARFNQVTGAWYNRHPGAYAEAAAQPNWRHLDPNWLNNRRASAEALRDAFNGIDGMHIAVEAIGPAPDS